MNRIITTILAIGISINAVCQTTDERIASAINGRKWSELRQLYSEQSQNLETEFLHPLSKFFIYHFYNQPDSAISCGNILLRKHQEDLGSSVASVVYLLAEDYARNGNYGDAAKLLHKLNEASILSGQAAPFIPNEQQYHILDSLGGFSVSKPNHQVSVPLKLYEDNRLTPQMLYIKAKINGIEKYVTFDTGAGANVITKEMSRKVGAQFFNTKGLTVNGVTTMQTDFCIIDSIQLGEVVYRNIPFHVVDFTTDNEVANKKIKDLDYCLVIGSKMMMPLEELQFDFDKMQLFIPTTTSVKPAYAPNFYYSAENQLLLTVKDKLTGKNIIANFDTGSSETELTTRYYSGNQSLFSDTAMTDTVRQAGIGGVSTHKAIKHLWNYEIGDAKNLCDSVYIKIPEEDDKDIPNEAVVGLPTVTPRHRVILNFKDMWINIEE